MAIDSGAGDIQADKSGANAGNQSIGDKGENARDRAAERAANQTNRGAEQGVSSPATTNATTPTATTPAMSSTTGAGQQMTDYDAYTKAAMGASPAEAMQQAQAAARQTAQTQSDQAIAEAVKAGKTAGAMGGQAALGAQSQAATAYGEGLESGTQQYFDTTKLGASLGSEMSNRLATAEQTEAQKELAAAQLAEQAKSRKQSLFGNIIGAVGGIASLFSDRDLKEDIAPDKLNEGLEKIRGYTYKYKGLPREEAGIIAQDLEETNMAPAVVETPKGKMIDTRRLTTMNTAALADQEGRLKAIEKLLGEIKNIPAPKKAEA